MGVDDRYKMWLRSLNGRCHGNRFFFTLSDIFFVAVCNKLCAVIHDNTNALGNKHCPPPGNGRSPLTHFLDIRMLRDTTRCANVAWTHENQLIEESTIINRRGGSPYGLQPGFALHLVIFARLSTGCTV